MQDDTIFWNQFYTVGDNPSIPKTLRQIVFDDIVKEIDKVKKAIKQKNIGDYTIGTLELKKNALQEQLDKLLKKGGLITEEDYNDSYNLIKAKEEQDILASFKKSKRGFTMFVLVGVALIVGIYLLSKNDKKWTII